MGGWFNELKDLGSGAKLEKDKGFDERTLSAIRNIMEYMKGEARLIEVRGCGRACFSFSLSHYGRESG